MPVIGHADEISFPELAQESQCLLDSCCPENGSRQQMFTRPSGFQIVEIDRGKPPGGRENRSPVRSPTQHVSKDQGATIDASLWIMNLGDSADSLYHVIFSFGTAPLYPP